MSEIALTPSDLAGAAHRRLAEAAVYIANTNAAAINVPEMRSHLDGTLALLHELERMQEHMRPAEAAE